ncbi:MAG TPA: ketol-acid reductoisomerase [Gammaproteobacteria bacterium]|nr:ketol-acid reductoisomerase [Gammaproteobacteria bacterium]
MPTMQFGSVSEKVITREEFPLTKAKEVLKDEVIAIIGYGVQGPAQALNLRDSGFKVIIGQRQNSPSWQQAIKDGWIPDKDLFSIEEACEKATFICYLLSDAAQIQVWPTVKKYLTPGKTLYFSHGFAVTYHDQTQVLPPKDVDVILVAPKGSGRSVRRLFLDGKGINSSYAVFQDATGKAEQKALAFGIGVGSGYLFQTDFKKEVYSDLFGERGVLMGALAGVIKAQYEVLRKNGHSPTEAFNETVEELTQSLVPLVGENGMDWMYANCSATAQRGALDWLPKFQQAVLPVFEALYKSVADGSETARVIEANGQANYKEKLNKELEQMRNEELWQVGAKVRALRPESESKKSTITS